MARTIGATNKPKLIPIKLSELNKLFGPDVTIMVSKDYENLIEMNSGVISEPESQSKPEAKNKTEVKVIDFNKKYGQTN